MALSDRQVLTLTSAAVLLPWCRDELSEFEQELIADAGARFIAHRRAAAVTAAEWLVIEDAVRAMRRRMRQRLVHIERSRQIGLSAFLARTRAA